MLVFCTAVKVVTSCHGQNLVHKKNLSLRCTFSAFPSSKLKTSTLLHETLLISETGSSSIHNLNWKITKDEGDTVSSVYCFQGLITFTTVSMCFLTNLNSFAFKYRFWLLLHLFSYIEEAEICNIFSTW